MNLTLHLFVHVFLALLSGFIIWKLWRYPVISLVGGVLGGVLIDLDHLIDYFFAFGFTFYLESFLRGEQFAASEKIYVLFHGWEYVVLLVILGYCVKASTWLKSAILSVALGAFFHLAADATINHGMTIRSYSVLYRMVHSFEMEKVVTVEHYIDRGNR